MKTMTRSLATRPLQPAAFPLFFALAFLPILLHLAAFAAPVYGLLAALGPLAAGFWLAASGHGIRLHFLLLGPVFGALLWAVNSPMLVKGSCCAVVP